MFRPKPSTRSVLRWVLPVLVCSVLSAWAIRHYRERSPKALEMNLEEAAWLAQAPHWPQALDALRQGRYEDAVQSLERHLRDHPRHTEALYQLALACLETGKEEESAYLLDQVRFNDPAYYPDATWHLALARLKQGDALEGRMLLTELRQGDDALLREKARVMLEEVLPGITPM